MAEITSMQATHKWASVEDLEKARYDDIGASLKELYSFDGIDECIIIQTCNRIETYIVSSDNGKHVLEEYVRYKGVPANLVRYYNNEQSLRHLFRLASGLESMVIGEDQILGQIKDAFDIARSLGITGNILNTTFGKAINVGKRSRTETDINRGSVSIGSAAVDLAEQILGTLDGKTIMVIGAGEMGALVAKALSQRKIRAIIISSRTHEHALELAKELDGKAVYFEDIMDYIPQSDVVISATAAPHIVIDRKMIEEAMDKQNNRKLLLIDIANPRDIETSVAEIPGVELHNIDSLKKIRDANIEKRKVEALKVEEIIEEELELLERQYKRKRADGVISSLYAQVENIRVQERKRAINRLRAIGGVDEYQLEVIDDLTKSLVNKILAHPTKTLRDGSEDGDDDFLRSIMKLFKIDGGD
ncbi:MAG: glutamyl-tRNA reductase [Methanosarcinales archaeon Met12]|nr:MAG: glutamyl-tRNA reductase [Methanosarcinales archaeon Met12]